MRKYNGMRMQPWPDVLHVVSDASRNFVGWATVQTDPTSFKDYSRVVTRALPPRYQDRFSTRAELAGSCIAKMQEMSTRNLQRMTICPVGDNTPVERHFAHRGSKSVAMNEIVRSLRYWEEVHQRQLMVQPSFMKGVMMIANGVDAGSRPRALDVAELQVSDETFRRIVRTFGQPTVDLMAVEASARCKVWIGPPGHRVPLSDAFSISWAALYRQYGGPLYCMPPPAPYAIARAFDHARQHRVPTLLVMPLAHTCELTQAILRSASSSPMLFQRREGGLAYLDRRLMASWSRRKEDPRLIYTAYTWAVVPLFERRAGSG